MSYGAKKTSRVCFPLLCKHNQYHELKFIEMPTCYLYCENSPKRFRFTENIFNQINEINVLKAGFSQILVNKDLTWKPKIDLISI
jgi:hypothetical protein